MKNTKLLRNCLFLLIAILSVTTGSYAYVSRDKFLTVNDEEQSSESTDHIGEKTEYSSASGSASQIKSEEDIPPVYSSENAREDFGVKTVSSYDEFNDILNSELDTFFVFGRDGCHYCEMYEPVLKEVAALYKIEIVYVNMALLTPIDYKAVLSSPLTIPAKCSKSGEDASISSGFGTPLTLFVRKGETYNCIRGYKDKTDLIVALRESGYVN